MSKLVLLFVLVCLLGIGVQSMNLPGAESSDSADQPLNLASRGFGCNGPFNRNEYQCNAHCKSNKFRGGYCNALFGWFRCDCYN